MDERDIVERVGRLVEEEHELERGHEGRELDEVEYERMRSIEVELDRCWDLLRQRRARKAAGVDPDDARLRDPDVVEHYQQ